MKYNIVYKLLIYDQFGSYEHILYYYGINLKKYKTKKFLKNGQFVFFYKHKTIMIRYSFYYF